ncbi:hypothetical protein [Chryseobacterium sp.]|uniref:FEKKY domain-containing protein n=1 Tax=Chryseobacterium sp. TaxID=1871047 RepID=UPI0031E3E950
MKRHLIIINFIIILLLATVYVSGYYFINYPIQFNFRHSIQESGFEYFPVILAVTAIVTYLLSSLPLKASDFKGKFLRIYPIINTIVILFFTISAGNEFIKTKKELSKKEKEYALHAEKDIKNDKVIILYAGGLSIDSQYEKVSNKIADIQKKYGVTYTNTGCIIDPIDIEAQKKYAEKVKPYLERRNGKGWENRMQKEIDCIK